MMRFHFRDNIFLTPSLAVQFFFAVKYCISNECLNASVIAYNNEQIFGEVKYVCQNNSVSFVFDILAARREKKYFMRIFINSWTNDNLSSIALIY